MKRKRSSSKKVYRKKSRKYAKKTSKNRSTSSLVRLIQKVVNRNIETKKNQHSSGVITIREAITDFEVIRVYPDITQGTGEASRVGSRVKPVYLKMKLSLYCFNTGSNTPPVYFDIYIFKFKVKNEDDGLPTLFDMQRFIEFDNSSAQYLGNRGDGLRPVNNNLFTLIKHKRVTMFNPYNTTGQLSSTSSINPNRTITFNLTKYVKGTWIYDDNTGLLTNDNMLMAIGATSSDGIKLEVDRGNYQMVTELRYKDA